MGFDGFVEIGNGARVYENEPYCTRWAYGHLRRSVERSSFIEWAQERYCMYQYYSGPGLSYSKAPVFTFSDYSDKVLITLDC